MGWFCEWGFLGNTLQVSRWTGTPVAVPSQAPGARAGVCAAKDAALLSESVSGCGWMDGHTGHGDGILSPTFRAPNDWTRFRCWDLRLEYRIWSWSCRCNQRIVGERMPDTTWDGGYLHSGYLYAAGRYSCHLRLHSRSIHVQLRVESVDPRRPRPRRKVRVQIRGRVGVTNAIRHPPSAIHADRVVWGVSLPTCDGAVIPCSWTGVSSVVR